MNKSYSQYLTLDYPENLFCTILECDHFTIDKDSYLALDYVFRDFPERTQAIFSSRFKDRLTLSEIASQNKISNQRVRSIITETCMTLRLDKYKNYLALGYSVAQEYNQYVNEVGIDALYEMSISSLDLQQGIVKRLHFSGINTIGDLIQLIERYGLDWNRYIRNLGKVGKASVEKVLKSYGYCFKY